MPFHVEVTRPVTDNVWDLPSAALVQSRVIAGGGADSGGVEIVEGRGQGW